MKNKKVALNDELLDKVSGGDGEGVCECGWPLYPGGACVNPLCPHSNLNSPVFNEIYDQVMNGLGNDPEI